MKYKRILMDIDDTLFDFQAGNRNAVGALMAELGLSSPTVFDEYQAINHACWEALETLSVCARDCRLRILEPTLGQ